VVPSITPIPNTTRRPTAAPPIAFSLRATRSGPATRHERADRQVELDAEEEIGDGRLQHRLQQAAGHDREHGKRPVQPHHHHEGRGGGQDRGGGRQQDRGLERGRQGKGREDERGEERRADHDPGEHRRGGGWPRGRGAGDRAHVQAHDVADHEAHDRRRDEGPREARQVRQGEADEQRDGEDRRGAASQQLEQANQGASAGAARAARALTLTISLPRIIVAARIPESRRRGMCPGRPTRR
jgi:hypothetical protein